MSDLVPVMTAGELAEHEAVIERGQQTFVDVGLALMAIREAKGYRTAGYATFEAYCQERWGWSASRSRQLIGAARFVTGLEESVTTVTPPQTEWEARRMMADQRREEERNEETTSVRWDLQRPSDSLSPLPEPGERPYLAPESPAETSERLLAQVGDPDGNIARARLRAAYTAAVYRVRSDLLPLDVEAVVAVLEPMDVERAESLIRDVRDWADAMERELNASRRLRVIGGNDTWRG